jgi:uncharacterized membrane protein (UPF0127 family)
MKRLLVPVLALAVLTQACGSVGGKTATISIKGRPLEVELARTKRQRARGLMNRAALDRDRGMLFMFREEEHLSFWMKDTSIPLTIAFLDSEGVVVDIYDMEPYDLEPVRSSRKCRYAIEVNRGFFQKAGLSEGDSIDLSVVAKR